MDADSTTPALYPAALLDEASGPKAGRLDLSGANLMGIRLASAQLAGSRLRGVCLQGAVLAGSDLRQADLRGADLRAANLSAANLRRADLRYADLRGACLLTADLTEVTATGADLREAQLPLANLQRALLRQADLRWAKLDGARLCDADLDGTRFEGACLVSADLTGARLTTATSLGYAFLRDARLGRTGLTRHHLAGGIGEQYTDLLAARETYVQLCQLFAAAGRYIDADWARYQAWRMATESHRPRNAVFYYRRSLTAALHRADGGEDGRNEHQEARAQVRCGGLTASGSGDTRTDPRSQSHPLPSARRRLWARVRLSWCRARRLAALGAFLGWHGLLWLLGRSAEWLSGYGTSLRRLVATLIVLWVIFGVLYLGSGAVTGPDGLPVDWREALHYSAAALTPVEAHPLAARSELVRLAALIEGLLGLALVGALGVVITARLRHA